LNVAKLASGRERASTSPHRSEFRRRGSWPTAIAVLAAREVARGETLKLLRQYAHFTSMAARIRPADSRRNDVVGSALYTGRPPPPTRSPVAHRVDGFGMRHLVRVIRVSVECGMLVRS
jgi:hypothetical protein